MSIRWCIERRSRRGWTPCRQWCSRAGDACNAGPGVSLGSPTCSSADPLTQPAGQSPEVRCSHINSGLCQGTTGSDNHRNYPGPIRNRGEALLFCPLSFAMFQAVDQPEVPQRFIEAGAEMGSNFRGRLASSLLASDSQQAHLISSHSMYGVSSSPMICRCHAEAEQIPM